ncbi:insecticidal delta-endotoxin Cry8Ea1 family protein [Bacillus thuringiensis]|uniref:insecticidal delta-endotoxin Cry8Ea1 family protein n=3 Tax=Bacillus thuringiensis TaxID=1428 RepID=UPI000AA89DD7|nr:insecticidal delta-endotoxin Cry8Ea1 family protein [Bacillus thuringiensis]MEC3599847.1 insecticidal delta-endotoxin Cry8Ea1 family protein [Bacillus thuringiensis]MED1835928.1 insecticidal delta-endotoxin Cry8Ea1 family protein [Bacillus thuringiensis]MED2211025.1 insecticidal delta-endotoxin Cry8Ea1 family protein [Bacillus thuringiensis]MED2671926.1 insecticidal delta-endotoxin Cry8Ea1 family protein [Bacillus thuringiensis]MED2717326.1 insecticidal delta-endotoxin Cry8Ea1 family protei
MKPNNQNNHQTLSSNMTVNKTSTDSLKNETTMELKNSNYKDCLKMSEHESIEPFVSVSTIQTGIGIAGKILGSLGVPFSGQVASLYSFILGELWPKGKSQWEIFMEHVEELVAQKISTYARNKALADLKGLGDALAVYHESLESWIKDRNNTRVRSVVKNQYINLELMFVQKLPSFAVSGEEVPLLPIYAQAANLHLLLLRDASTFGKEWGFSTSEISTFYKRQSSRTREYSDYCSEWYNTGLNRLKGTNAASWVRYNQFRRDMTLMVLDLVALFPCYDTHMYPIPTSVQLTREVYTDPNGAVGVNNTGWFQNGASFSAIENAIIRQPHLYDFITNLTIYTRRSQVGTAILNLWAGHKINFNRIGSSNSSELVYGASTNPVSTNSLSFVNQDVFRTISLLGINGSVSGLTYGLTRVDFDIRNRNFTNIISSVTYNSGHQNIGTQTRDSETELPPETTEQPNYEANSHLLSHISMSPTTAATPPVYSWTHHSADRTNTISSDRITQIPLVKAHTLQSGTTVVKGPGFTGGDILRRTSGGPFAFSNVNLDFNLSQRYRARIRYASTTNLRIYITVAGERILAGQFNKTMEKGDPLTFQSFSYATINTAFTFPTRSSSLTVGADTFDSGNEVYVDRFELIPDTSKFEAESDLEKA